MELQLVEKYTQEQIDLITKTVAKGATKDELQLFLYRCHVMKLNPLKPGQVHFVKYGTGAGTMIVGIEGFRSIAVSTGRLSGISRGAKRNEKGELISAWAEVHRKDWNHPAREEVPFVEYNTGKGMWAKMPETMLKKCAEVAALRMAFPDDLGGVYESAELDQADQNKPNPFAPSNMQPAPEDCANSPKDDKFRFTFGQWNKKCLSEIYNDDKLGPDAMIKYLHTLDGHIQNGKYPDKHKDFEFAQDKICSFLLECDFEEAKTAARTWAMNKIEGATNE